MSRDSRENPSFSARWKCFAALIVALLVAGIGSSASVQAQDATPAAMDCVAPDLPPGTPTPMEDMAGMDMASPMAEDMGDMDMGTPMAEEEAAPVEAPVGTPAEGDTADEILAAATNLVVACVNGGDLLGAAALMTDNFLMSEFGLTNPYDIPVFLEGFSFVDLSIDNPMTYEDGSVSADLNYKSTPFQITGERIWLVDDGGTWKVDSNALFTPAFEGDSTVVGVSITETTNDDGTITYAFEPTRTSVTASEVLIFHVVNTGSELHELAIGQLPEGADPMGLLDGSIPEDDVLFVGQVTVAPGEEVDMVLSGVPAGVYTMLCFFPDSEGVPHAANGMVLEFEVTAAE